MFQEGKDLIADGRSKFDDSKNEMKNISI
jgi:hypothetical protein